TLSRGHWDEVRDRYADQVIDIISEYAPNIRSLILHRHVLTPPDLERTYGMTGGNIFHGAMSLDQMFFLRPVAGWARYRTPIRNLYLCGSGTHPGGGVMGAPGYNAARIILRDGIKGARVAHRALPRTAACKPVGWGGEQEPQPMAHLQ